MTPMSGRSAAPERVPPADAHGGAVWASISASLGRLEEHLVGIVLEAEEFGVTSPVDRGVELPPGLRPAEVLLEKAEEERLRQAVVGGAGPPPTRRWRRPGRGSRRWRSGCRASRSTRGDTGRRASARRAGSCRPSRPGPPRRTSSTARPLGSASLPRESEKTSGGATEGARPAKGLANSLSPWAKAAGPPRSLSEKRPG